MIGKSERPKQDELGAQIFMRSLASYQIWFGLVLVIWLVSHVILGGNKFWGVIFIALGVGIDLASYVAMRQGAPRLAGGILVVSTWMLVIIVMALSGGLRSYVAMILVPVVMVSGLLFRVWGVVVCAVASAVAATGFLLFQHQLPPSIFPFPTPMLFVEHLLTLTLVVVPLSITLDSLMKSWQSFQQELARREHAENILSQSEEQLRTVLDSINDLVVVYDPKTGDILDASQRVEDMYGYSREEIKRILFEERNSGEPPYTRADAMAHMNRAMVEGCTVFEWRARHRSGRLFWVEVSMRRATIGGEPRLLAVCRDITARKDIQDERLKLASIIEQMTEDIILTDLNGVIQYVNPAFTRTTGYEAQEVLGQKTSILKSGRHNDKFYGDMWSAIKQGRSWSGRIYNRRKDQKIILQEAIISPVFDSANRISGFMSIKRDITGEADLENRLLQAQKMESIGTLAGGIAHDFNNLLTVIIGNIELVRMDVHAPPNTVESLDQVLRSSLRAKDLVKQILAFSRQQERETSRLQLGSWIKEGIRFLRSALPANIVIQSEIQENLPDVEADPTQMHQVLMNLATNAGHAMREKNGILTIRLKALEIESDFASTHPPLLPGPHVHLQISDNGHGMPPDVLQRIFEPFFTTKPQGEGTGLGLSVVYGIVKAHGGSIHVYSQPGVGTTFHLYFPASPSAAAAVEAAREEMPCGKGERILFVDDAPTMCRLAEQILARLGYVVTSLTSPEEAINLFGWDSHSFDLIITDFTMPGVNGIELLDAIRKIKPNIPVVLSSGLLSAELHAIAQHKGVKVFVPKPFTPSMLAMAVNRAINS